MSFNSQFQEQHYVETLPMFTRIGQPILQTEV